MSVLVLSQDEDAARALCSALSRSGQIASWQRTVDEAWREVGSSTPFVLVGDTDVTGISEFIEDLREESPWIRIYLMTEPESIAPRMMAPVVVKPFDAAQLADLLAREAELAELELGRRSLQAHADELALLVQASFEAIIGLSEDGLVLAWNRGAENLYGYSASEIVGRHIELLEPGEAVGARLFQGGRHVTEVVRRKKSGEEIVVHLSLSPVPQLPHTSLRFAEVSLDVSARRKLVRELEHAERLATIGRFAASMAHELNNPLAVIRSSANFISDWAAANPELKDAASDMELAAERISYFVQHVCGFARREQVKLDQSPISKTVDIALRMVRPRAEERRVKITTENIPDITVAHDPPRLAQALVNVLANAIDAAALGGHQVSVRVREQQPDVLFEVEDNGPGLSKDIKDSIFEPFTTTKPHGQGTGLGLAITSQIIRDHGGTIQLENRQEEGARATISLKSSLGRGHCVLVLEAEPSLRRVLASTLRSAGYNVITAASPEEASVILLGNAISLLISSLTPDELLHLRASQPNMPLLLLAIESNSTPQEPVPESQSTRPIPLTPTITPADLLAAQDPTSQILVGPLNRDHLIAAVQRLCRGRYPVTEPTTRIERPSLDSH